MHTEEWNPWDPGPLSFHSLSNCWTVFQSGWPVFQSHQLGLRAPIFTSLSTLVILIFFFFKENVSPASGYEVHLLVVLICVSLMTYDVEHLFTCLLAFCTSSLEKRLFRSFAHVLTGYLVSWLLSGKNSSYILDISPLSDVWYANIFSHFESLHFLHVLHKSFQLWWHPIYLFFPFVVCAFDIIVKDTFPKLKSWKVTLMFSFNVYSFSSCI